TLPGTPSLVVPEGGELTWSVWVKMTSPQPRAVLYSRREGANGLVIGLDNGVPFVEVTNAGSVQKSGDGAPIVPGTWRHIATTAKNGQMAVFVDGNPYATWAAALPTMGGPAQVGREAAASAASGATPSDAAGAGTPAAGGEAGASAPAPAAPAGEAAPA